MSMRARTLFCLAVISSLSLANCDSSGTFEDCTAGGVPGVAGSRQNQCPKSVYNPEDPRAREVVGIVRRGEDVVPGAIVRVQSTLPTDNDGGLTTDAVSTVTDAVGVFNGLRDVAFRYDMAVRFDPANAPRPDVLFFFGLANRYVEPSIEAPPPRTFARAWASHVDLKLDRPIASDRSLAFFVGGANVWSVTGDLAHGLTFLARDYTAPATLHVVEYPTSAGLGSATAYGKVDLRLDASTPQLGKVALTPIQLSAQPLFDVWAPPGFSASSIEIRFGYSGTSDAVLAKIPIGTAPSLQVIPNAGFTYRVVATNADGEVSDSGENSFDIIGRVDADGKVVHNVIQLPEPPRETMPPENLGVDEKLGAAGLGVFEHVLVPQTSGPAIRLIARAQEVALPDLTTLGLAQPAGAYTWTVRAYPRAQFVEALGGLDARRYQPMSTSRPHTIVLH